AENELATAVAGSRADVDFAVELDAQATLRGLDQERLERWHVRHGSRVWEHSWVRIALSTLACTTLDLVHREIAPRTDGVRFVVRDVHGDRLRVPASYALRIALFDAATRAAARGSGARDPLLSAAARLSASFTNDNTAPEILSGYLAQETGT